MRKYRFVQFISWEVFTGSDEYKYIYAGLGAGTESDYRLDALGQCRDIEARVAFTVDAMNKAYAEADPSPYVLKVFMGPEGLYRGAGGAYLHDLIDGWSEDAPGELLASAELPAPYNRKWGGLFGGLRAAASDPKFDNWVFVFGTTMSASFPAKPIKRDGELIWVLNSELRAEIYNTALIQRGGARETGDAPTPDAHASRKHHMSDRDFLTKTGDGFRHVQAATQQFDPSSLVPSENSDGSALFQFDDIGDGDGNPILFGIEICLDHKWSGRDANNRWGRIRTSDRRVKIQLVPSCGLESLKKESIWLLPGSGQQHTSYAFNCDGLYDLSELDGSHTEIRNGAESAMRLVFAGNGVDADRSTLFAVAETTTVSFGDVSASSLWHNGRMVSGAGSVRVMYPFSL
jgi:hypothetical protein